MESLSRLVLAAALSVATLSVQAALVARPGGMIYDSTRNITWLADMNCAKTSGFDADGLMKWAQAATWANNLVYGGFDDWRPPTLNPADTSCGSNCNPGGGFPQQSYGYNCTGGELSGLFDTDLDIKVGESVLVQTGDTAEQIANLALFSNVQDFGYWSGTQYAPESDRAWGFYANGGFQNFVYKEFSLWAVAVRPRDVAAVPEPQTLALALLALGATLAVRRRRPL